MDRFMVSFRNDKEPAIETCMCRDFDADCSSGCGLSFMEAREILINYHEDRLIELREMVEPADYFLY